MGAVAVHRWHDSGRVSQAEIFSCIHTDTFLLPGSSSDSVLMLYSYAGIPAKGFALFAPKPQTAEVLPTATPVLDIEPTTAPPPLDCSPSNELQQQTPPQADSPKLKQPDLDIKINDLENAIYEEDTSESSSRIKENTMSELSIALTLISILVAFR